MLDTSNQLIFFLYLNFEDQQSSFNQLLIYFMGCTNSTEAIDENQPAAKKKSKISSIDFISPKQDFLTHHLLYQKHLTQYSNPLNIRIRQILEHNVINQIRHEGVSEKNSSINELFRCFYQRIFLQSVQNLNKKVQNSQNVDAECIRKLCQKYLVEVNQVNQYVRTCYQNLGKKYPQKNSVVQLSDFAIAPLIKQLYQKLKAKKNIQKDCFADIQEINQDFNLLSHFSSKCYADPSYFNSNTLIYDLKYLFNLSSSSFDTFTNDMKSIIGFNVTTSCRISIQKKHFYNRLQIRELIKQWVQDLMERSPEQMILNSKFFQLIKEKSKLMEEFHFQINNSSMQNYLIQVLLNFLEVIKFYQSYRTKNHKFGFFIYDLLNCQITVKSSSQVLPIIQKIRSLDKCPSGQTIQLFKIKKSSSNSILVSFRYGITLTGQIKFVVETKSDSALDFFERISKGFLGPTIQLMTVYEQNHDSNIQFRFNNNGVIKSRQSTQKPPKINNSDRKCPIGHIMLTIIGYDMNKQNRFICDYCGIKNIMDQIDFCLRCSLMYCKNCKNEYKKINFDEIKLNYTNLDNVNSGSSLAEIQKIVKANNFALVMFYINNNAASQICKNYLTYTSHLNKAKSLKSKFMLCNVSEKQSVKLAQKFKIERFPTFMLINSKFQPVKTIIGSSIVYVPKLLQIADRLIKNQSPSINIYCNQDHGQQIQRPKLQLIKLEQWNCKYCSRNNLSKDICDLNTTIKSIGDNKVFNCNKCKSYRCLFCGFLAINQNIPYQDFSGSSYLSFQQTKQTSILCTNNHKLQLINKPKNNLNQIQCNKCSKKYPVIQEYGLGYCKICQQYVCHKCLNLPISLEIASKQRVNHFVQISLSQKCNNCTNKLKKVVCIKKEQMKNEWKCMLCNTTYENGYLHIGCNTCKYQICMNCINQKKILQNRNLIFVEQKTTFTCNNNHSIYKSNFDKNENIISFLCNGDCKSKYYINTVHFNCVDCKLTYCQKCAKKKFNFSVDK